MSAPVLVDAAERSKIRKDLGCTLVVEAAAGTGKTSELVQRIVRVVASGAGTLSSIVAVTFTEKAAGEMKLRLRTELDRALSDGSRDASERAHLAKALFELEAAKIGTIHALCADLLRVHPVEADVDPAFEVADAERSRLLLRRAFDQFLEAVSADPPEGMRRVLARAALDERGEEPRSSLFHAASRLVETRDFDTPFRRDALEREPLIAALREQLQALAVLGSGAKDSRDPLARALTLLGRRLRSVQGASPDVLEALLRSLKRDWEIWERPGRGKLFAGSLLRSEVLSQLARVREELERAVSRLNADLAACLSRELRPVIAAFEAQKAEHGVLDFFDLLLRTRNLLVDAAHVRDELQQRFTQLFVDEFQDTDPVQTDILLLLAADDKTQSEPFATRSVPGKLFVVGDPKQSIYRFRRADVTLYERVKQHLLTHGAELVRLSTSFRSLPAIQSVVNAAFAPLMHGDTLRGQASYVRLSPFRAARLEQPALIALPVPAPFGYSGKVTKKAVNASLPDAVAALLQWLLQSSGYQVPEEGREVPLSARHICLLFRRFRAYDGDVTRDYVRALEARRIPHVLSGGRAFYAREEVAALTAVLKAIEWPDDALHVYATLRGPFVAFNDDLLLQFRTVHGSLSPFRAHAINVEALAPGHAEIAAVLGLLVRLHRARNRVSIASSMTRFLSELRVHAGVAIWPTGEQSLGNLYKLIGLARSYERKRTATSFRGFIAWLEQNAEEAGAADASVVEESSDGVRIMTVHAAKGLEFPVVVLCDPTAPKSQEHASRYLDPERRLWAQPLCDAEPSELTEQRERVREHDEAELVRLTYVAVTRARELLVVPVTGRGPIEGWLDPLAPAIFPDRSRWRSPLPAAPGVPRFGANSAVELPPGLENDAAELVAPGRHIPQVGEHHVVWWDPNLLDLSQHTQGGLMQEELLRVDAEGLNDGEGSERYAAFRATREAERAQAAQPSVRMRVVTAQSSHASAPEEPALESAARVLPAQLTDDVARAPLQVHDTGSERGGRALGPRFGSLVHALLQHCSLTADEAELLGLGTYLARGLGAPSAEVELAVARVKSTLAHPLLARARAAELRGELFRETPITTRDAEGTLLDGVVDLVFREHGPDGARMILVDYKTDARLDDLAHYSRQLAGYADAIARALAEPVDCILLRV